MLLSAAASILGAFRIRVNVSLSLHNVGEKWFWFSYLKKHKQDFMSFSGYTGKWFWRESFFLG